MFVNIVEFLSFFFIEAKWHFLEQYICVNTTSERSHSFHLKECRERDLLDCECDMQ